MPDISDFKKAASVDQKIIVNNDKEGVSSIQTAPSTFHGHVVSFVSNVPLISNSDAVKKFCAQFKDEDKKTYEAFIRALSDRYEAQDKNAYLAALEKLKSAGQVPLNQRIINSAIDAAENFHGKGQAKDMVRNVVIRIWPYKDISHTGHAALSFKDQSSSKISQHTHDYISWDPANLSQYAFLNPIRYFGNVEGKLYGSYTEDKTVRIAKRTQERLSTGLEASKALANGEYQTELEKSALEKKAEFLPTSRQKEVSLDGGDSKVFGVSAEKMYMPMIGFNKAKDEDNFSLTLFGLSHEKMKTEQALFFEEIESGKTQYTLASKTQNCAAIAGRFLKASGSEVFSNYSSGYISDDPNNVMKYGQKIYQIIDKLNQNVASLQETTQTIISKDKVSRTTYNTLLNLQHLNVNDHIRYGLIEYNKHKATLLAELSAGSTPASSAVEKEQLPLLQSAIDNLKDLKNVDTIKLMARAKALTLALVPFESMVANSNNQNLAPVFVAAQQILMMIGTEIARRETPQLFKINIDSAAVGA